MGQTKLLQLERELNTLLQAMLRVDEAILVLEELLSSSAPLSSENH